MASEQPKDAGELLTSDNHHGGIFINLQVPSDAEAGVDSLTFVYGGSEFDVLVPAGSLPGDVLQIQVGNIGVSNACDHATNSDLGVEAEDTQHESSEDRYLARGGSDDSDRERKASFLSKTINKRSSLLSELGALADDNDEDNDDDGNHGNVKTKRPKSESDADDAMKSKPEEKNITVVSLGQSLIHGKDTNEPISLHLFDSIEEASNSSAINKDRDGTNLMVWASGIVLAQALTSFIGIKFLAELFRGCSDTSPSRKHRNKNDSIAHRQRQINCLELGSGQGVCGLALAHALHSALHCNSVHKPTNHRATVLLTDHGESAVQLLRKNIQRNLPSSFRGHSADADDGLCMNLITAESLIWGGAIQPSAEDDNMALDDEARFHLILGSDILYNTHQSYGPLVNTIQRYLHPNGGTILLAVRWRKPDLEREFFRMVEEQCKDLKFQLWKDFIDDKDFGGRRCPCVLTWKEYGNPESESSNRYFHETRICIENKDAISNNASLADVTEQDMELMTNDEYSKFEEMQVQIYVGRYYQATSSQL